MDPDLIQQYFNANNDAEKMVVTETLNLMIVPNEFVIIKYDFIDP